ncbi:hypothetical protein [Shewanella aestuarii]|uniref:Uncharacterized protein n=1 Tax=Shewanella aestuarii TaxID=1028752 RepID=A0A6G9QG08_9GAMM|nr:hypothetical protein [Shewanella aestuarii]QIR13406.1 hypothetical protein HBH39_01940 [Shewanella aestuarii]
MTLLFKFKELSSSTLSFLNTPEMIPVLSGALIGAISAGAVTLLINFISSWLRKIEIDNKLRSVIRSSLENNKLMCESNLGILKNEIEGMNERRRFTINPLFRFRGSGAELIFSNSKLSRFEVEYLWGNLSSIDAINNQLTAMIQSRQTLQIKIRGESNSTIESELSSLLVEYDGHLIERHQEALKNIISALKILNMSFLERNILKFRHKNVNDADV